MDFRELHFHHHQLIISPTLFQNHKHGKSTVVTINSPCFRVPARVRIDWLLGEPASRFTSAIERAGNWKKVREQVLEYGWMQLEETLQICKKGVQPWEPQFLWWCEFGGIVPILRTQSSTTPIGRSGNERR
jgi:hypothetical protein